MPLPTIADVYRCTVLWDPVAGLSPRNIFHIRTASGDVTAIGAAINDAFDTLSDNMWRGLGSGFEATSLDILPLDGSTATVSVGLDPSWVGGAGGELSPASAVVVSLHSEQRGSRGRGRLFVGPVGETSMENGQVLAATQTEMAEMWGAFIAALPEASPSLELVIASYAHADAHAVTSVRIDTLLGTQRRRQDQLR